jgi:DMSO/TMAO reductase YedYZ molybdopterin-dependent catalytic subunit
MPNKTPLLHRRSFLGGLAAACVAVGAFTWGLFPEAVRAAVAKHFPTRTVERGTFRFDAQRGELSWADGRKEPFRFVVDGLVEKPLSLSYAQLRGLPQVRRTVDFHCVEGWSVEDVPWGGVDFTTLLGQVRPRPEAKYAVFHSLGRTESVGGLTHYVEAFPLADLRNPALGAMLALDLEGQPLPFDRGAPARVISPYDLAYKSIKFVTRMELTANSVPGWWTRANPIYSEHAPVDTRRLRTPDPRRR